MAVRCNCLLGVSPCNYVIRSIPLCGVKVLHLAQMIYLDEGGGRVGLGWVVTCIYTVHVKEGELNSHKVYVRTRKTLCALLPANEMLIKP